jgi:hypothetical protein
MKNSHLKTPRTMNEAEWTPGYRCAEQRKSLGDLFLNAVLAVGITVVVPLILIRVL